MRETKGEMRVHALWHEIGPLWMADLRVLPWDAPVTPGRTIGWVFQVGPDDPLNQWLEPGATRTWEDASASGKEPGQPVLFLQRGEGSPTWNGWGHILALRERWKAYGVRTICSEVIDPPLRVTEPAVDAGTSLASEDSWENRALGTLLGFLRYRDRTPYREVGSRAQRLTSSDLYLLGLAQPRLRELGHAPRPVRESGEWMHDRSASSDSEKVWSASDTIGLRQAEMLVKDDLRRLFGDEVEFSSLKTTPGRFRGRDYWVVEGSFWINFAPRNFQYAITVDTGELAAKKVDR